MSADPHPMSSASVPSRKIEVGKTYTTTSGRKLVVTAVDYASVAYRIKGEGGLAYRHKRSIFLAAIRSANE